MALEPYLSHATVPPLLQQVARDHGWTIDELFRRSPLLAALYVHYAQHEGRFGSCPLEHEVARLEVVEHTMEPGRVQAIANAADYGVP